MFVLMKVIMRMIVERIKLSLVIAQEIVITESRVCIVETVAR